MTTFAAFKDAVQRIPAIAKRRSERAAGGPARLEVVLLLGSVLGLDAADKATMSAVADGLKSAFHIGNTEIGLLIAAVSFVGAIFTLPAGVFADRTNRKRMMLIAVALWTAAMVISGIAWSFAALLVIRLFLGAATAAVAPGVASLVGDFLPPQARSRAYGLILAGELVGTGIGFLIAGEVSVALGWRWAFYAMGLPGAAVAWLLWRFLSEPARGGQSWIRLGQKEMPPDSDAPNDDARKDGNESRQRPPQRGEQSDQAAQPRALIARMGIAPRRELILQEDPTRWNLWRATLYLLRIPTYRLLIIASTLGYYFFAGVRAFAVIYLTEHFHVSRSVVVWLAIIVGLGGLAGVVSGGRLSEWLLNKGRIDARIIVPGTALLLTVLLIAPAIWTTNIVLGTALMTCGAASLAAANPPIDAARLDIVHAGLWGRGEAGRTALRGILEGGAPLLFGAMSGWLGGGAGGLEWTFLIMLIPVIVAASLAIPARRTYPRDVATADASMRRTRSR